MLLNRKNLLFKSSFLFWLLCSSYFGAAQQTWTIFNNSNSALPENSVRCIAIAPNGTKWIGTDYGLASYNGIIWNTYFTFNSGLPDNAIRSIAVDSSGVIWIGTFAAGLVRYDGTTWTNYNTLNSNLPDDYVRSIAIDTLGNKWVGTIGGLAYFDDNNWTIYNSLNTQQMLSNNIGALSVNTNDNNLVFGTINGGVVFIQDTTWTLYTIWNSNLPDNTILGIDSDSSGNVWLATPSTGLAAYTGGTTFLTLNTVSSLIPSNNLTSISISDKTNDIWIGSLDSGLIRRAGGSFISYKSSNSPMPEDLVQVVQTEKNGIVWIGTQTEGLIRIDENLLSGFADIYNEIYVSCYPTLADEVVHVDLNGLTMIKSVHVYDISGRKVKDLELDYPAKQIELKTGGLNKGAYIIRLELENNSSAISRFMKQ